MSRFTRRFRLAFICLALAAPLGAWSAGAHELTAPADESGVCWLDAPDSGPVELGGSCFTICGPCEDAGGVCVHVHGGGCVCT